MVERWRKNHEDPPAKWRRHGPAAIRSTYTDIRQAKGVGWRGLVGQPAVVPIGRMRFYQRTEDELTPAERPCLHLIRPSSKYPASLCHQNFGASKSRAADVQICV